MKIFPLLFELYIILKTDLVPLFTKVWSVHSYVMLIPKIWSKSGQNLWPVMVTHTVFCRLKNPGVVGTQHLRRSWLCRICVPRCLSIRSRQALWSCAIALVRLCLPCAFAFSSLWLSVSFAWCFQWRSLLRSPGAFGILTFYLQHAAWRNYGAIFSEVLFQHKELTVEARRCDRWAALFSVPQTAPRSFRESHPGGDHKAAHWRRKQSGDCRCK